MTPTESEAKIDENDPGLGSIRIEEDDLSLRLSTSILAAIPLADSDLRLLVGYLGRAPRQVTVNIIMIWHRHGFNASLIHA